MIGIFLKELRENLKWAALILGVLLVMVWHEIRDPEPLLLYHLANNFTVFPAPLAGLLMGVVQALFETRPDNWAFVVHRPTRRLAIFAAKCAAGLLLLYGSLALPCLIAAAWTARPGNVAMPFQGRMMLPMLADVLGAGCWYFVGMVLTLRRARWVGTRLLPLGLTLAASSLVTVLIGEFWQVALILLAVQCVGAVAAWGVFASNGAADESPITRGALGAMILPGALAVGFVLFGISQAFVSGSRWQYYQIDRDGGVVRVTQTIEHGERNWAIADVNGQPLPKYEGVDLDDPANVNLFVRFNGAMVDERTVSWPLTVEFLNKSYRSPIPGVIPLRAVAPPGVRLRSLALYDVRRRIIDLYDPVTHMPIGTVGPAGFSPQAIAPSQRFPGTPLNLFTQGGRHVLAFDSIVYWIELEQRRVRPVFTPASDNPIFSAAELGPPADPIIVLATRRSIHVLHPSGEKMFSAPLQLDPDIYFFQAALLPGSSHLVLQGLPMPGHQDLGRVVLEFATDGKLVRRTDPPRLPEPRGPKLHETAMFGAIFPPAARPMVPTWILDDVLDVRSTAFPRVFEGFMIVSAICCAGLSLLIARRCRFGAVKAAGWAVASLLLGPAGVVVMLGINEWPARESCAACGQSRLASRRHCTACSAAPAPPAFDGREIFEPTEDVSVAFG
jgi:hypothetical protein